ncbi:MAG: PIN domain-containing protein [Chloroflexota bacterium]|nr:MAG: PIN domain-containing protein [Chloroflexota bacterium]
MICLVDASVLYAAVDVRSHAHGAAVATLARPDLSLILPALAVDESLYLVGKRLGARFEARFIRGLADFDIVAPTPADCARMADLVDRYQHLPLGGADASIVALAERLGTTLVATLDRRHFSVVRTASGQPFQVVPDL